MADALGNGDRPLLLGVFRVTLAFLITTAPQRESAARAAVLIRSCASALQKRRV